MRFDREAFRQKSSISGRVKELLPGGYCNVETPDGREIKKVHFSTGFKWPVGSWIQMERVGKDWQVIGFAGKASGVISIAPP